MEKLRVVFFGTSDFALPALEALDHAGYFIAGVITVPDQPIGRKKVVTSPPIKLAATQRGIPIFQPATLTDDVFFEAFKNLTPDLCVVAAYGLIIPQRYLDLPKYGFLNIHPSLLPKYRGPTPIQSAILHGDEKTGITIMKLDAQMDHGPTLAQKEFSIGPDETYQGLHGRLAREGATLLVHTIQHINDLKPKEQDHSHATVCKIYTRADGKIDWSKPAPKIYNQIRALNPEPGTWTTWHDKILTIKKAIMKENNLVLRAVQLEGKKETLFADFLNGYPDFKIDDCR